MSRTRSEIASGATAAAASRLPARLVLFLFLPFAGGYFLSYLYRSINAVIAPNLAADVGISAADLGFLTSVYFLTFAVMQLPVGLALDRFGPRRVGSALLLLAALGALLFALAEGLSGLVLGRALIGAGVSACLMSSFKAFALWFPPQRLPTVNGALLAVGGLGAISATAPVEWLLGSFDWRTLFLGLATLTALVALWIFAAVPEHEAESSRQGLGDQLAGLRRVFRDPLFWRLAPLAALCVGCSQAVFGLWAGPWLRDVVGFDRAQVANHLLLTACATTTGFLLMGALTERLTRLGVRPVPLIGIAMGGFTIIMLVLASGMVPASAVWLLLLLFGFIGTSGAVNYALLSQHFGSQLAGRANTALNLLIFIASFLTQWGLGVVIGIWEDPLTQHYAPVGYRVAFGGIVGLQLLALYWFFGPGRRLAGSP
ncbi:MAG: MFS transporter [Xanthomonadaceae bacterium]|nr:MFS transporter [Xanthomonadaceae bacterium]